MEKFRQVEGSKMQLFSLEETLKLNMGLADHDVVHRLQGVL
jgi:hypothetical protein